MRVLVAGCGYVGWRLAERLAADGDQVWTVSRGAAAAGSATHMHCDLGDREAVGAALSGIAPQAVCYLVAPARRDDSAYRQAYLEALGNLLEALPAPSGVRLLLASSTAVYGQRDGSWVDERSPTVPGDFTGERLLEAESLAIRRCPATTVVRFGGIYGPGRGRLVDRIRAGRALVDAGRPRYANRIHRDDCVGLLRHLLRASALSPLYLGVDDDPADLRQVQRWLCSRLKQQPAALDPPLASDRTPRSHKRCSNARLRASGYQLHHPSYREGYGALIDAG